MTISFVAAGAVTSLPSTGSYSVSAPSGIADGDLLIAIGGLADGSITPPSGWTQQHDGSGGGLYIWTKTAASEPGSYSFGCSVGRNGGYARVFAYRGATPLAVDTIGTLDGGNYGPPNTISFSNYPTVTRAGTLLLIAIENGASSWWGATDCTINSYSIPIGIASAANAGPGTFTSPTIGNTTGYCGWMALPMQIFETPSASRSNLLFGSNF